MSNEELLHHLVLKHVAPTELKTEKRGTSCYKHIAPTELRLLKKRDMNKLYKVSYFFEMPSQRLNINPT
jgi:hypothetical protein